MSDLAKMIADLEARADAGDQARVRLSRLEDSAETLARALGYVKPDGEVERLRADLETERMRLTACSIAATRLESFDGILPAHRSASLEDVIRCAKERDAARAERDAIEERLAVVLAENVDLGDRASFAAAESEIYLANQIQREASCARLREALGLALSVAEDCRGRWSRGHPDRVAKARAIYDTTRTDGTITTSTPAIPRTVEQEGDTPEGGVEPTPTSDEVAPSSASKVDEPTRGAAVVDSGGFLVTRVNRHSTPAREFLWHDVDGSVLWAMDPALGRVFATEAEAREAVRRKTWRVVAVADVPALLLEDTVPQPKDAADAAEGSAP